MSKLRVKYDTSWEIKDGGRVEYFQIGNWYMELLVDEVDEALISAKESIKVHKAWYRWLKKNRKKYKTP